MSDKCSRVKVVFFGIKDAYSPIFATTIIIIFKFRQKFLCHGFVVVSNNWGTTSNNLRSSEEDFLDDCSTNHKNKSRQQNNDNNAVSSTQK